MDFQSRVENWVESYLAVWNGEDYFLNDRLRGENYTVDEFIDDCIDCFEEIVKEKDIPLEHGSAVVRELEYVLPEQYKGVLENSSTGSLQSERMIQHYLSR